MTITAKYENGVFRPLEDVVIPEGTVVEVHVPAELPKAPRPSIADSSFAGMWRHREDIADGVDYVNRLRSDLHG
jgi:predicted DNA-binding antitoxin AbrB/MazE fold protein